MTEPVPTQLMGTLGVWMRARPAGVDQSELDVAARLVLDMGLLGVETDDEESPALADLSEDELAVITKARRWATTERWRAAQRAKAEAEAAAVPRSAFSGALSSPGAPATPPQAFERQRRYVSTERSTPRRPEPALAPRPSPPAASPPAPPEPVTTAAPEDTATRVAPVEQGARSSSPSMVPAAAPSMTVPAVPIVAADIGSRPDEPVPFVFPPEPDAKPGRKAKAGRSKARGRRWRRYEELFWWTICLAAVALIVWRQLG